MYKAGTKRWYSMRTRAQACSCAHAPASRPVTAAAWRWYRDRMWWWYKSRAVQRMHTAAHSNSTQRQLEASSAHSKITSSTTSRRRHACQAQSTQPQPRTWPAAANNRRRVRPTAPINCGQTVAARLRARRRVTCRRRCQRRHATPAGARAPAAAAGRAAQRTAPPAALPASPAAP